MAAKLILAESDGAGLRVALLCDGRLSALEIDRADRPTSIGAVVAAKAGRSLPGLGVVVTLPGGVQALLTDRKPSPRAGETLWVQPLVGARGDKLGTARRSPALTGRALIHLPFETGVTASRRLTLDPGARAALESRLAELPGGWILRRTVADLPEDDFVAEARALAAEGDRARAGLGLDAPDAFRRLAADYGFPVPDVIAVSGAAAEVTARRWSLEFAPSLLPRIVRHEGRGPTLFDMHDVDAAIDALAQPSVALPGGGSLVIEATEALTAIDVNAGAQTNAVSVNLAAAAEIARQLRLRHIGGIVVIDFVSLARSPDRARVMAALTAALATDAAQTHILPMSAFGLVEMTRERRGPGLELGN